jgi:SAM-dependent methyltransferase
MPEAPDLARLRREYADRDRRLAHSDLYSPDNPGHAFMIRGRERAVLKMLAQNGFQNLEEYDILEVGCGRGGVLAEFLNFGAAADRLHGVELLEGRVEDARKRLPQLPLACADGQDLPYREAVFDLVLQYTVFSSILADRVKAGVAREMLRVLKPGGMILWYDYWLNPTNPHARGIRPAEIRRLFGKCRFQFNRITLAPPLCRRLAPVSGTFARGLEKIKLFNTHYLAAVRP